MGGRRNTLDEQRSTLRWAEEFEAICARLPSDFSLSTIRAEFVNELRQYFALCGLARHKYAPVEMTNRATELVFKVRVAIERSIVTSILLCVDQEALTYPPGLFQGSFYGSSKKQGVSVRMPLSTCVPTKLCAGKCYAHDALDAAPQAVVRGAVNGAIAEIYDTSNSSAQDVVLNALQPHTRKAVKIAEREVAELTGGWSRYPYIRFAHVGEMPAHSRFANAVAQQVKEISEGRVRCVVYTRHPEACGLDDTLWIVNFTLDTASESRRTWAPSNSRIVFSAFDGRTSNDAEINFLEHHPWSHDSQTGNGNVCPATAPDVKDRTCDGQQCDRCFVPVTGVHTST